MRFRGLWIALVAGLGCGLVGSACSAPDPGALTFGPKKTPDSGAGSSGSSGVLGGSSGSSGDAGKDTGASLNGFFGAPPYDPNHSTPSSAQQQAHTQAFGSANPQGSDCLDCHKTGGTAPVKKIGGTVYSDQLGTKGLNSVEIRVVDSATKAEVARAYTDPDGNFHMDGPALPAGSYLVGVRNATSTALMIGPVSSGACSQTGACHGRGGGAGPIHLP